MKNAKVGITGILFLISGRVATPKESIADNKKNAQTQSV